MACLIDTGILLRAFDPTSPSFRPIRLVLRDLWKRQERVVVAVQNLAEFWNVSTRPSDRNGYGLPIERVARRLATIERGCKVITEDEESFRQWKMLLRTHAVSGVAVHDARLVSVMLAHRIANIFTLNEQDFRRYPGITITTPASR